MWGRRRDESTSGKGTPGNASPRPLSAIDELLRRADWERLSDAERDTLRSDFASYAAASDADATDDALRQWVAALVTPTFQTASAQVISSWLSVAAPGAHLYIGGDAGQGRHSLAASLARHAMSQQPSPPDYCYVPQPASMDQAV
ncbi:MAG: hypothetical protein ACHQ1E_12745, partial [Ktedonobacterales bacterium]